MPGEPERNGMPTLSIACALSVPLCLVLPSKSASFWLEARLLIFPLSASPRLLSWQGSSREIRNTFLHTPKVFPFNSAYTSSALIHQVFYSLSHTSSTLVDLCPTSRKKKMKKRCPQAFQSLRAHMGKPWAATAKLSPLLKHIETICHRCLMLFITLPSLIHHSPRFCKVTLEIPTNLQCPQAHLPSAFVPRPNIWRFEKNQQCCRKCSCICKA